MRALACPASLKGVLTPEEAALALGAGLRRVDVLDVEELPIADGGEGTLATLERAVGGNWRTAIVSDPLGRPISARWLMFPDRTAAVEAAEAIGLPRLAPDELDPLRATSRGLGELLLATLPWAPSSLLVCLGGVATVDGGAGMRVAVGDSLAGIRLRVACDVRNPLLGERGAARVFGPQKGASPSEVEELERRLAAMEELRPYAELPGAGAAGGLGAALAAFGADLLPGAEFLLSTIGFRERVRGAALVVTGEGTVDRTTLEGKAPGEVLRICREEGVRCALFGGRIAEPLDVRELYPLSGRPEQAAEDLAELGESLGLTLLERT